MKLEKKLMLLVHLCILFLLFKCENEVDKNPEWLCKDMDTARLEFKIANNFSNPIEVFYQYEICNKCDLISLIKIDSSVTESVLIDSYYSYVFNVTSNSKSICENFVFRKFGECGIYQMEINDINGCSIKRIVNPNRPNIWLILGAILYFIFIFLCIVIEKNEKRLVELMKNLKRSKFVQSFEEIDLRNQEILDKKPIEKKRLRALDTYRGMSLFLMIFVNYGSGGYKFLQHVPWHGLTIADFVFPWFLWIMGFSIPLSTNSLLKNLGTRRFVVFRKIFIRTLKMFFIGIMLNSRFGVELKNLRIFGVLQRIAICYFIVAVLELILYKEIKIDNSKKNWKYYITDILWSKFHFVFVFLTIAIWFLMTFLIKVPGCPAGYIGPGGLEQHGQYYNCTGGIAGYLDILILGKSHLYQRPTPLKIYKTTQPFDPEGIFGIFNSVVLTYLGVHAGRTTIFYKNQKHQIVSWTLWGLFCFVLFSALTQFDLENGLIPVNKNLWTFTYTLITGSSSFLLFTFLFYLIDIKNLWSGNPFIYLGMNSILFYVCHSLFATTFPNQWIVSNTHLSKLLMNIWGTIFWTLLSVYFYRKKWFFNL